MEIIISKRGDGNDDLIDDYIRLRNKRYLENGIDWENSAEHYFDNENPNTRFALAIDDDRHVLGGGRILHKTPHDTFSLDFQSSPEFRKTFQRVLQQSGLSQDEINLLEIGGVAVDHSKSNGTFMTIGSNIMNAMANTVKNESNYISISRIDKKNTIGALRSAEMAGKAAGVETVVFPDFKIGDAEVVMALYSDIPAVQLAFEQMKQEHLALSPCDYLKQERPRRQLQHPESAATEPISNWRARVAPPPLDIQWLKTRRS